MLEWIWREAGREEKANPRAREAVVREGSRGAAHGALLLSTSHQRHAGVRALEANGAAGTSAGPELLLASSFPAKRRTCGTAANSEPGEGGRSSCPWSKVLRSLPSIAHSLQEAGQESSGLALAGLW